VCAFIGILVYSILYSRQSIKAISRAVLTDATIECPNAEQFRRDAIEVLYAGRMQPYAIMYCKIKRYNVIVDMLGEQKANEIFSFVANVFEAFCNEGETYGYVGDGEYLMMIRYRNEKQIGDKITLLEAVINKSDLVKKSGVSVKFAVGVYLTAQNRRATVPQMIEGARLAAQTVKKNAVKSYAIYTEEVDREIANNERIEARMEESLANGEFKLFMQPKYNVKRDSIDSAEALVRWFDPSIGDYRFPGDFISLFEANGFIIKLDHFIYLEVLKYMQAAAERGEKIAPVSVNVSRVTALQDNFIEFYVQNKRDHQIGDGFITLEITESFAMESDEKLLDIVNRLHENGIRCSINDFGSGYSSYNTIKQIPIDEIKIDRIFLAKGLDQERDDKIIMSVVQLAKDLGVEVVQEGVETEAMFNRVVEMGCEVIQGYYYAKAIPIEEYRIFINSNTSIQFKKKVK
jgi:EAL domain-containing protein (putative c-di-GMP-specific phosphodiesterase class I)/GGDEF domain-containing protein